MGPSSRQRAEIQSLARDVVPVFQPIVDLTSGTVVGVEALARFCAHTSPVQCFSTAWEVGLGLDLELAAARAAVSALNRVPSRYFVAVNFSVQTILTSEFYDLVAPVASRLVVEVPEHARVPDYDAVAAALRPLRNRGLRLSIDDVGSGFSSLEHIVRLRPDIVKLASFFTRGVHQDRAKASLTRSLAAFARTTDVMLVAEGIETAREEAALLELGILIGQGFYLGTPQPLAEHR